MPSNKELLDSLESELLKRLFYGDFAEANNILKKEEKLLSFIETAQWLLSDIDSLSIGLSTKRKLAKKGIVNFIDAILLKPIRCEDYTLKSLGFVQDGEYCAVTGSIYSKRLTKKLSGITLKTDDNLFLFCNWFRLTPFLRKRFMSVKTGQVVVCEGRLEKFGQKYVMNHPRLKLKSEFVQRKETVYPSILGMRNSTLKNVIEKILSRQPSKPYDYLPYTVISKNALLFLNELIEDMHKCANTEKVEHRLKYEEIFLLILGLKLQEARLKKKKAPKIAVTDKLIGDLIETPHFKLTNDQIKVAKEIFGDIKTDKPMLRLLQGDVGCGKTVVALLSSIAAIKSGYQVAFMAPTQPLALQIYKEAKSLMEKYGFKTALLISSTKNKQNIYEDVKNGKVQFVVGTHALLEENVQFANLGFIVIDEQHRFGVEQRKNLMNKGVFPHVLIMSATPIPRSLSMVMYSKSSLSTIKEKPKGRVDVKSMHFFKNNRKKAYEIAVNEIKNKHQVYIIAPLVEESENLDNVGDVVSLYRDLKQGMLAGFNIGILHGRMSAKEKEKVVEDFKNGALDCLVSTTVIEVGIDAPNATVMIVENAERFGLSQLHQLRGRVGRGTFQSYAIFITNDELSDIAKERIKALLSTNDGFEIAELDYKLRGSGEIMGIKQHGKDFAYTDIVKDRKLIEDVKEDVERIVRMKYPINDGLLKMIEYKWQKKINYVYVG